jgi:valyl-tRNA synthetase
VLDAVPAWICKQCGEVYFEKTEVESIQAVLKDLDKRTEKLAVAA